MDANKTDQLRPWALSALGLALIGLTWAGVELLWNPWDREPLFHARRLASLLSVSFLALGMLHHRSKTRVAIFVSASMLLLVVSVLIEFLMHS